MTSTLDEIMDKDPLSLTEQDLDAIIDYQRKQQGLAAMGKKATKVTGPKVSISLESLGLKLPVPAGPSIKRRV